MDVPNGNSYRSNICFFEGLGTGLLLISVNWGAVGGKITFAVAFCLFSTILFLSPVCGSHFNPAVTLAVAIKEGSKNAR